MADAKHDDDKEKAHPSRLGGFIQTYSSFLSSFVIGTIDQLLFAALKARHVAADVCDAIPLKQSCLPRSGLRMAQRKEARGAGWGIEQFGGSERGAG